MKILVVDFDAHTIHINNEKLRVTPKESIDKIYNLVNGKLVTE